MSDLDQKFMEEYQELTQESKEKLLTYMQVLQKQEIDAYHKRMEEQMEKELAEIEARMAARPEITCQPVSPKIKERIDAKLNGETV